MRDGVIVFYKASGMTSQTAVNIVKRLTGANKAGHCGTLDPLACGVLPIMIGNAVKASEYLTDHDKTYIAGIRLGVTYDSGDITGSLLYEHKDTLPSFEEFASVCKQFEGEIMQVPPMYSALKRDGMKLVDLARKGVTVEREARRVNVYSIKPFVKDNNFFMEVACSRGTYIRTLCEDIGARLGCGGAMSSLERTVVGAFDKTQSFTEENIKSGNYTVIPSEELFPYKKVMLPEFFEYLFSNGQPVYVKKIGLDCEMGENFRVYGKNGFFATAYVTEKDGEKVLKHKSFFVPTV